MARRVQIAGVGEACLDRFDPEGDIHLGGISVNFARAAHASGADASVFAAIGDDAAGARLRELLAAAPIDTSHVRTLPGPSTQQRVRVGEGGERILCGFEPGASAHYRPTAEELALLRGYDAVAVPWSRDTATMIDELVRALEGSPVIRACDVSIDSEDGDDPAAWIAPVRDVFDLVFVGGRKAHFRALQRAARGARATVVLTAGADGAIAITPQGMYLQPTMATTIVDTLGCGDAFQGGYVTAHASGEHPMIALQVGARRAAEAASRRGA